ncbi:MAG: hydantoinase/oxoprolinase family protein, partial [Acidobacteriota bacterium]
RYEGQSYELNTPVERTRRLGRRGIARIVSRFGELHEKVYAYGAVDEETEFVNVWVTAIGQVPAVRLARSRARRAPAGRAVKGRRPVYFEAPGFVPTPVYARDRLVTGQRLRGPALVEEAASATLVPPDWTAAADPYGNLVLTSRG